MANRVVDKDTKRYLVTIVLTVPYKKVVKANTLLVNFLREELDMIGQKGLRTGRLRLLQLCWRRRQSCLILAVDVDGPSNNY